MQVFPLLQTLLWTSQRDWSACPLTPTCVTLCFLADLYVWSLYYIEKEVFVHAHKKFKAHSTSWVVIIHAIGGFVETVLMLVYFLNPHSTSSQLYGLAASWTALIIHIPAGFMLTPRVWGLKNITVGGYLFVGLCQLQ